MLILAQAALDPTAYQQYGIAGLLGIAFALSLALLRTMILKHAAQMETQQKVSMEQMAQQWTAFLGFVKEHRGELGDAMETLGQTVALSSDKLSAAILTSHNDVSRELDRQSRLFEEMAFTASLMARVREAKANGSNLSQEDIDKITRAVVNERKEQKGE